MTFRDQLRINHPDLYSKRGEDALCRALISEDVGVCEACKSFRIAGWELRSATVDLAVSGLLASTSIFFGAIGAPYFSSIVAQGLSVLALTAGNLAIFDKVRESWSAAKNEVARHKERAQESKTRAAAYYSFIVEDKTPITDQEFCSHCDYKERSPLAQKKASLLKHEA